MCKLKRYLLTLMLVLFLFQTLIPCIYAAETNNLMDWLSSEAKELRKYAQDPIWQTILSDEIDDLQVIPGYGVLVGQTKISWDSYVYIPSYGPYILYDFQTGKKKWEFQRGTPDYSESFTVLTYKPFILISRSGPRGTTYTALEPESGKTKWTYKTLQEQWAALDDNSQQLLIIDRARKLPEQKENAKISPDVTLNVLDLTTGKSKWKTLVEGISPEEPLPGLKVSGNIILLSGKGIIGYSLAEGKRLWSVPDIGPLADSSFIMVLPSQQIVLPTANGKLFKISGEGRILWQTNLGRLAGLMVERDGLLYLQKTTDNQPDELCCIYLNDGKILWSTVLTGNLTSTLLPAEGKLIYTVKNEKTHTVWMEFREARTGKLSVSRNLPAETILRFADQLSYYPGQVVIAGERWVGAFRIADGQRLWFHIVSNPEVTYFSLVDHLGGAASGPPQPDGKKSKVNYYALGHSFDCVNQQASQIRLSNSMSVNQMESIRSMDRLSATTSMLYATICLNLEILEIRKNLRDQSDFQHWNMGLQIANKLHQQSVQGDYYIRSCSDNKSDGVLLVNLKNGSWAEVSTSPHSPYYFDWYMNFKMPSLSTDGKQLFVRGIGLNPGKWKAVKDKTMRVGSWDMIRILPAPSILSYDISNLKFIEPEKYAPSHLYGYVDKTGKFVIEPQFEYAGGFENGIAEVQVNGRYGFINKTGRLVLEPKYEYIGDFENGYAVIKTDQKEGIIDESYQVVAEPIYDSLCVFSEGLAAVKCEGKWGFIDKTGQSVIPPTFTLCGSFYDGLAWVYYDKKFGFIDKTGQFAIPAQFDSADGFSEGLAPVLICKKGWGYIDTKGNMVLEPQFSEAKQFVDGVAIVKVDKKWGLIDKTGKLLVEAKYEDICDFKEGLARVHIDGKYGYIDKTGKEVIEPIYEDASVGFINGYSNVELGKEEFFIDKKGKRYDENPSLVYDASKENKDLTPKTLGPRYWEK